MNFFFMSNVSPRVQKLFKIGPKFCQIANLTSRSTRGAPLVLDKPFPYEEKPYLWYHKFFDQTIHRVCQENARIVLVEGPIAAGKTAFAKAIAEEFDMHYIPAATMDDIYVLPSGFDMRKLDSKLPKSVRSYDHKNFCVEPVHHKTAFYQMFMLKLKFYQFVDALAHILNTGQGVVLERSYYSDRVFMMAMHENKYVSTPLYEAYMQIYKNTRTFLPGPHLVIYLDVPVPVVQERIRTRNYSYEQNSPALTENYLISLEKFYKQEFLKKITDFAEVLVYDWSNGGDVELIIDDIEKLDLDITRADKKFGNWQSNRRVWNEIRSLYTNKKYSFDLYFDFPYERYPEFEDISHDDLNILKGLVEELPESKYDYGYNIKMGDKFMDILFKAGLEYHRRPRHIFLCQVSPKG